MRENHAELVFIFSSYIITMRNKRWPKCLVTLRNNIWPLQSSKTRLSGFGCMFFVSQNEISCSTIYEMKRHRLLKTVRVFVAVCDPSASGGEGNAAPWTTEEQKLLEQALKTYPVSTTERWEKIAAAVPGRNKKDCMKRYKVCWTRTVVSFCICLSFNVPVVHLAGTGGDGQSQESCSGTSGSQE